MKVSRKSFLAVIAVGVAVLTFLKTQLGLEMDVTAVVGGLAAIVLYILFEAKLDFNRAKVQGKKWGDPKFLTALAATILAAVNKEFGLNLPAEIIIGALTLVMTFLLGKKLKEA